MATSRTDCSLKIGVKMRYFGGQVSKIDQIKEAYFNSNPRALKFLQNGFVDPFSGSGLVAKAFSGYGNVIATDYANFAFYLSSANLLPANENRMLSIIDRLNNLVDQSYTNYLEHNFVENYSKHIRYFTVENACRIVGYREEIEKLLVDEHLFQHEYQILLGLLVNKASYLANTRLLFDGALKNEPKHIKLFLSYIPTETSKFNLQVQQCDYSDTIKLCDGGVLYLNPPSLPKDYRHYYHVLDTIIQQKEGMIDDKAGRLVGFKEENPISVWTRKSTARMAFYNIMLNNRAEYIVMTYNKNGVLSLEDIATGFLRNGVARTFKQMDLGNEVLFAIEKEHNQWGF